MMSKLLITFLLCFSVYAQARPKHKRYPSILPKGLPVEGVVTSVFGYRIDPFTHRMKHHNGMDIAAPIGTPIHVRKSGVVSFAGLKPGYGRIVIIKHKFGVETIYAHNFKNKVKKGQYVRKGQVIALVGMTGRTTGPHVHYEILVNGKSKAKYYPSINTSLAGI